MYSKGMVKYQYGIVAYFDILGFKSLIKNNEKTPDEVVEVLSFLKKKSNAQNVLPTRSDVDGIAFSDSFVRVVMEGNAPDVKVLVMSELCHLENIQRHLIQTFGLLVRGAVTIGRIFIENNIVFGPAVIRAVDLEENCTKKMPVVLLDHNIDMLIKKKDKKDVPKTLEEASHFTQDGNPSCILNYGKIFLSKLSIENGEETKKRAIDFLTKQREVILSAIKQYTGNQSILDKYKWLACYHNRKIHEVKSLIHFQSEYRELCEQLVTEDDILGVDSKFCFQTWN